MKLISRIYTYRFSQRIEGMKNWLYTKWISRFFGCVGEGTRINMPCILQGGGAIYIYIGSHTLIKGHCVLGCWTKYRNQQFTPKIEIGDNCNIGEYTQLSACNGIVIGEGLLTGQFVYIGDNSHGGMTWEEAEKRPVQRELKSKGPITIGRNVWLGDRVAILGGVTIGDNVIIGTNAVVTHDIPSNCVAAGIPAKVIKSLKN